jgi:hypothetical protein
MQELRNPSLQLNFDAKLLVKFLSSINRSSNSLIQTTESMRPSIARNRRRASRNLSPFARGRLRQYRQRVMLRNDRMSSPKKPSWIYPRRLRRAIILKRKQAAAIHKATQKHSLS